MYMNLVDEEIIADSSEIKQLTFAPSQMRCDRVSWFRLRGVQPDVATNPDRATEFIAEIGTACHELIQHRVSEKLQADWIEVEEWVRSNPTLFADYEMNITKSGYESRVEMTKPYPVRFGCDGIIRFNNKIYILEIKTTESATLADLIEPKQKHMDQIRCYSTLLQIPDILFFYQDRTYGDAKCFEVNLTPNDWDEVKHKMDDVIWHVDANIAPDGLPVGDPDCSQSMCPYYRKCREWGR